MATRFRTLLRDVAAELEAPHPARVRILEELSSDLEDLYDAFRAEGLADGEARRRAEAMLAPTPEAARALAHLHRPIWVRLADRYSDRTRHRAERALLIGLTLLVMGLTVGALAGRGLLRDPSPFLGVVLALAAAATALTLAKAFQLYLRGEYDPGRLRAGLGGLLVFGCAAVAVAAMGTVVGLASTADRINADVALQRELVFAWIRSSTALLATSLMLALGCGLAWIVFVRRAAVMEQAEAELLLRPAEPPPRMDPSAARPEGTRLDSHRSAGRPRATPNSQEKPARRRE